MIRSSSPIAHDRAAVGVGDEQDRPLDRADEVADGGGIGGEAAQRIGRGADVMAVGHERIDHAAQLANSAKAPWTRTIVCDMTDLPSVDVGSPAKTGQRRES